MNITQQRHRRRPYLKPLLTSPRHLSEKRVIIWIRSDRWREKQHLNGKWQISARPWAGKVKPVTDRGLCLERGVKKATLFRKLKKKASTVLRKCQSVCREIKEHNYGQKKKKTWNSKKWKHRCMNNDWFRKPQLKARGETRPNWVKTPTYLDLFAVKTDPWVRLVKTEEVMEVRQHKTERTAGENFKIRGRENAEVGFSFCLAGLNVPIL